MSEAAGAEPAAWTRSPLPPLDGAAAPGVASKTRVFVPADPWALDDEAAPGVASLADPWARDDEAAPGVAGTTRVCCPADALLHTGAGVLFAPARRRLFFCSFTMAIAAALATVAL